MTTLDYPAGNADNMLTLQITKRILGECEMAPGSILGAIGGSVAHSATSLASRRLHSISRVKKNTTLGRRL